MSALADPAPLLGATLHVRGSPSPVKTAAAIGGASLIAVYVSASWCGPCRQFTPQLAAWYLKERAKAPGAPPIVVFASLDRDEESFTEYFKKMPWPLALPYGAGEAFAGRFSISAVPTLLVFTRCGALVTAKGVEGLTRSGLDFPWVWGGARIGARVTLRGLEKAPHLNGQAGVVVGAAQASGRFSVRLAGAGAEVVAVREEALGAPPPPWGAELVGRRVTLRGLEKKPLLNGMEGLVEGVDEGAGRLLVRVGEEVVAVKKGCVVVVEVQQA